MTVALVGREAELETIDALLAGLDAGRAAAVAVFGEPGIGKTRMLAELVERADARGHLTLAGSASELARDVPFWAFGEALEDYVRGLDPLLLEPLGEATLVALQQVLPGLPRGGEPASALPHERYRAHLAVRALLERLATRQPLLLLLDDLHWADSGTLELLLTLLRRPPSAPMLLAFALRPHVLPERFAAGLERATRAGSFTRVELLPLTFTQARALLEGAPDPETVYAESGGNPFYLEQLVRSPRGTGTRSGSSVGDVPPAVTAALAAELAELSEPARAAIRGAAVAGDPFEPELAAAAAGMTDDAVLDAVDELLEADLARRTDVPRRFRFRHPLVRRAVYDSMPGGSRLAAHRRCADALAAWGASAPERAGHVELCARPGEAEAVATLRAAGLASAHVAPATAARWFEGARRLLPLDAPVGEKAELLLSQAESLLATGQLAESHRLLLEGVDLVAVGDLALRLRVTTKCAEVEHLIGRYSQAEARLEQALGSLADSESSEAVDLMLELAINGLFRGEFVTMNHWAASGSAAAEALGDRIRVATAVAIQAAAEAMGGAAASGRQRRDDAARLIDPLPDEELASHLDGLVHLALAEMYLDCFEEARSHADRAFAISRATGQGDYLAPIAAVLGTCSWVRGRVRDSIVVLEEAVEASRIVDDRQALCWMLFNLADARSAAGVVESAVSAAEESWELARSLEPGPLAAHAACALGLALVCAGRVERAAEVFPAAGGSELPMIGGAWRARYLEAFTRALDAAKRRPEAETAAAAARSCAAEVDLPFAHAMADLAEAALALVSDPAHAAALARGAADALDGVGHLYDATRARVVAGRALAASGDGESAVALFERAAAEYGSFGVDRYRAEAERELRKLGRAVYHRSGRGQGDSRLGTLTQRELQLTRLVVDRKTNTEIAAELFLSKKTIETHLRNIFRKVGVSSRVELAREIEDAERDI